MKKEDLEIYKKIREHLAQLHVDYFNDSNSCGHHKSNEGYVGILYRGDNWFEAETTEDYINKIPKISMVEVYSYLFGPNRLHTYSSLERAWEDVRTW